MSTAFLDFDGTLIDCRGRHYAAYRSALVELGATPLAEDIYWARRLEGASTADLLDDVDKAEFSRRWVDLVESPDLLSLDELLPGAMTALTELRAEGWRLVLVTMRRRREALLQQLDSLGLRRLLSRVVCHGDALEASSKAGLMRLARCGAREGDVVVGDSEGDIGAAREHGLEAVAVAGGVRGRAFLEKREPDAISASLGDLPAVLRELRCGAPSQI